MAIEVRPVKVFKGLILSEATLLPNGNVTAPGLYRKEQKVEVIETNLTIESDEIHINPDMELRNNSEYQLTGILNTGKTTVFGDGRIFGQGLVI